MQSPFGGWRHHLARWEACHWIRGSRGSPMNPVPLPPPQAGALWVLSHGAMSLQESIERFILPPLAGEVRQSRIGGGERSESIRRMLIMPYDTESQSRNADFIGIALWAIRNPRANGPSNLRTLRTLGPEARQPSHRRCVQRRSRIGGGERSEPIRRMLIMPYDTESKSRNVLASPFRGRGPRSGEGMYEGKNDYDTRCGRDRRKAAL